MVVVTLIISWLSRNNNSPRPIHKADINQWSSIKAKLSSANSWKKVKKKAPAENRGRHSLPITSQKFLLPFLPDLHSSSWVHQSSVHCSVLLREALLFFLQIITVRNPRAKKKLLLSLDCNFIPLLCLFGSQGKQGQVWASIYALLSQMSSSKILHLRQMNKTKAVEN